MAAEAEPGRPPGLLADGQLAAAEAREWARAAVEEAARRPGDCAAGPAASPGSPEQPAGAAGPDAGGPEADAEGR